MPRVIVRSATARNQLFELPEGETTIGRGDDAKLVLPNVSVSRLHARILVGRQGATVEDAESQNGTFVNGQRVQQAPLKSFDEVQLGKFTLVFLGDNRDDRFYKGRFIGYLQKYDPAVAGAQAGPADGGATFALSKEALKALAEGNRVTDNGRLVLDADAGKFWYPEDRSLSIGKGAQIPCEGWFTGGECAEVRYDGRQHIIEKKGFFVHVSVNDQGITKRPLRHGDRVRVGATRFRYECT
jgi:pSer/pThr/pTyr-binding forkhead associated (FHA) protein